MSGPALPEVLRRRPFTVAELRDAGLPPSRLRHPALHLPTRAVRSTVAVVTLAERAEAFAKALPEDCAFSHATAARLLGIPLPERLEEPTALDVMRDSCRSPIRRRGCVGHRGLDSRSVVEVSGLRVVAPADTWCDLGDLVARGLSVEDLVVAGDAVANRLGRDVSPLNQVLEGRCRPRGGTSLDDAVGLVRAGVRSPMESRARLMFVRAGFPEPEVNATVLDRDGGWLLEGDLVWRAQRTLGEYQGHDHASIRRRSADAHRSGLAADAGWTLLELFAEDLWSPARRRVTLQRFARALGLARESLRID